MPDLTNTGLQYEQPPQIIQLDPNDPTSKVAIPQNPITKYFRNRALLAQQFAEDAGQAVQPSISTVQGRLGQPDIVPPTLSVTQQDPGNIIGPRREDISTLDLGSITPGQNQTTIGMNNPPTPILPKFFKPSFASTLATPEGLPAPINPAQSKLGKLLAVARMVAQGAAAGSQAGTFGGGFEAAQVAPYERAQLQQGAVKGGLENQLLQAQVGMLPWQRTQMLANLRWKQSQAARNRYVTPSGGGIWDVTTQSYAPGGMPPERNDPVEQRRSFAEDHPDMFNDPHEKNNFVLYGHEPKVATTNPNEWQLRIDAASGDPDAQAVLDQRFREEKSLAGIRGRASADNRASKEEDAADAEQIASTILNSAGGDPDKALKLFDQHSGKITDPDQRRLGPAIRKAIRERRQINPQDNW